MATTTMTRLVTGIAVCLLATGALGFAASAQGAPQTKGTETAWTPESDCTTCHTIQAGSMEPDADCPLAIHAGFAVPSMGDKEQEKSTTEKKPAEAAKLKGDDKQTGENTSVLTCTICHNDEKGLASRHKNMDLSRLGKLDRLKKTSIDENACLACHESYDALVELTAKSDPLIDANGTKVNPHQAPGLTEGHESMDCASCHKMHSEDDPQKTATTYCTSCHHENVYECGTCH